MNRKKQKVLTGKADFSRHRNDMFWKCIILDDNFEFFHPRWSGYDDDYWWENVATKDNTIVVTGDKGTQKKFRLDYETSEVCEVR